MSQFLEAQTMLYGREEVLRFIRLQKKGVLRPPLTPLESPVEQERAATPTKLPQVESPVLTVEQERPPSPVEPSRMVRFVEPRKQLKKSTEKPDLLLPSPVSSTKVVQKGAKVQR